MGSTVRLIHGGAEWAGLLSDLANGTEQWVRENGSVVKESEYELTARIRVNDQACFLKLYRYKSIWRRWFFAPGMRRPLGAYRIAREMAAAGSPVPAPLACLQVPEGVVLLMAALPESKNLADVWADLLDTAQLAYLLAAARAIATVHLSGYAHGDCKWHNLVSSDDCCYLVDLDASRPAQIRSDRQARDVARFTVNAEEMQLAPALYTQFLNSYADITGWEREELVAHLRPHLDRFRRRHRKRYGIACSPLL